MWGEPHAWIREQIEDVERIRGELERSEGLKRDLKYGLRAQVLVRDTEEEA